MSRQLTLRFALARCATLPEPDSDEAPLLDALRRRGHAAEPLAWDEPGSRSGDFDAVVLRATWNYHLQPGRFLGWARRMARSSRLVNPLPAVRWNLHKRYLGELEADSVPVVPTEWVPRRLQVSVPEILARRGWDDVVVKPAVSASSFATRRFRPGEAPAAEVFLRSQHGVRDMMVQPYMRSVEEVGERAVVWIDGEVTHAVRKTPRFAGADESVVRAGEPDAEERRVVAAALARWSDSLCFARVDLMRDDSGRVLVSEVELIEPSLFFPLCPAALERCADALVRSGKAGGGR